MCDFACALPESAPAGWVEFVATNVAAQPRRVMNVTLNEGVTFDDVMAAIQGNPDEALGLFSVAGGGPRSPVR